MTSFGGWIMDEDGYLDLISELESRLSKYREALEKIANRKIKWENTLTMELQGIAKKALDD